MTKFAFEVPHFYLRDFEDLQDFHFILSLHWSHPKSSSTLSKQKNKIK